MLLLILLMLLLINSSNGYMISSTKRIILSSNNMRLLKTMAINSNENDNNDNDSINTSSNDNTKVEGYLGSDLSKLGNDKQSRVLFYIGIALLPCLFLIPFVMSRDFVPPTDDVSPFGF